MINWTVSGILMWVCWAGWQDHHQMDLTSSDISFSPLTCDLIVDAGPDTNVCSPGGTIDLMGSITGDDLFFLWSPSTGLSDPFSLTPTANITGPITYSLTGWAVDPNSPNLIVNGDFEAGNTGFLSEYVYVMDDPILQTEMFPEGTYTVIHNPNLVHSGFSACMDHTGGGGNMMVVNGAANLQDIWCQTITVSPNTYYNVSAWVASVNPASPAILRFSINGNPLGNIVNAPSTPCLWVPFNAIWNSGNNTTAEICILNLNTALGGNDFALDDISITSLCAVQDEVEITLYEEEAPEPDITGPAFLCEGETGIYTANFPPEPPILSYTWTIPGGAIILSGQGTPQVTVQWDEPQEGAVCLEIETRCDMAESCFDVTVGTVPALPLISGPSTVCPGETITLYTPEQDPDDLYDWIIPSELSIISGEGTNEIDLEWNAPGEVEICLEVTNACGTTDNCTNLTLLPEGITLFDTTICQGTTLVINGNTYGNGLWSGTEIFTSAAGCDSVVEIEIMEAALLEFVSTAFLCPGDSIWAGGMYQTEAGIYTDSFTTVSNCDSVVITEIILSPFDTTWLTSTTCDPSNAGTTVTTYEQGLCDSTVISDVVFVPADTLLIELYSCLPADTGQTLQMLLNQYGCDSLIITTTHLLLSDTTLIADTACDPGSVGVFTTTYVNADGCDSTVITTVSFLLSDTTWLTQWVCTVADTGTTSALFTNSQGCDSLVITQMLYGGSDTTFVNNASCNPQDTGLSIVNLLNGFGCDSVISTHTALLRSDTAYITQESCTPADTGISILSLTNVQGCDSVIITTTSLLPEDDCSIVAFISVQPPACNGDSAWITLDIRTGKGPFELLWMHADGMGTLDFPSKGIYAFPFDGQGQTFIILNASNGLSLHDTIFVEVPLALDIDLETAGGFNGFDIRCHGDETGEAWVNILSPGTPPWTYQWSSGTDSTWAGQLQAGTYMVTVTDYHGCIASDTITLTEPPALDYMTIHTDIRCAGEANGTIMVSAPQGGVAPWSTSLNGLGFNHSLSYTGLSAGTYDLVIMDQNGCTREETISLSAPDAWSVLLGPDTTVAFGSIFLLSATLLGQPQGLLSVQWSDQSCDHCLERMIMAESDLHLSVIAADENGCIATDEIHITVVIDRNVYIPNVFSPNSDQVNDLFWIMSGSGLERVEELTLWDRWGNLIFESYDFPPDDPAYAWDGRKKGEPLNPGVFVYKVVLVFRDGRKDIRFVDVTLVR